MSLRVIGGLVRGRYLKTLAPQDLSVRPMLGRMKKSIFDIIQFKLPNSKFLDLFAGVGSVGIEALSRGADLAVFVELSLTSLNLIKENVSNLGFQEKSKIIKCDVLKGFELFKGKYDIVFMGPPYKDNAKNPLALTYPTLKNVAKYDILKDDSVLISQKHVKEPVKSVLGLELVRTEKFGDTEILFYRRVN
ncbi:MAG: 16S rRNA (guanine(966)-N(2))-methyltransferase RsmD [Elusimicrobiota bacterium]|nr:16S rRNA (guanine(966)-N(2))-methyltransferase RsmD [Elusimicrobiota bacterium]